MRTEREILDMINALSVEVKCIRNYIEENGEEFTITKRSAYLKSAKRTSLIWVLGGHDRYKELIK